MDRRLASKEHPLLNQGMPYVPDAGRTASDDYAQEWDAGSIIRGRTHMTPQEFNKVYQSVMRFFHEQEKFTFRQLQTGEKKPEEFYRDASSYLKRTFPQYMNNANDFGVMMERLELAMFKYDVLQPLIDHPDVSDIKICSPKDIRVRIKGNAYQSNATFIDDRDLTRFVEGLSFRNCVDIYGRHIVTFTDEHDENYILRFTVSNPVICASPYPLMHIRKVAKTKPDFDELIRRGMLNNDIKLYLIDRAKASRGIVFAGPPGCVDKKTEFFNGKEWKSIADWNNEEVLQFDPVTNEASLVMPERYIKEPCPKMYHFETKYGIDQTLSPEHRVIYYNRTHKNGKHVMSEEPQVISAEELAQLQSNGKFFGRFKTDFKYSGPGMNLTDAELKLMLAVICDGYFRGNTGLCYVNVKKQRKKDAMEAILQECGIDYHRNDTQQQGYAKFSFHAPRMEKEFGSDWYSCTQEQLQLVCDNVLQWDGSVNETGRRSFETTIKASADFIQFAFSACGYRATMCCSHRKGESYKTGGKDYIRQSESYSVIISDNTMVGMDWHNDGRKNNVVPEEVVPEDGFKYCFTVPTHALVLRRNNKIFITGNSGKSTALNAFIEYIPKTRESLVIQENDELFTSQSGFMFKHPTYNFHGEGVCTLEDLGKMALVEGCNEFIVGEVKGGEMRYVMTLMNAGGYSALTVHSTNAYETLDKMADLVKYGSSYSFDEARRMLKAFDTVVYMEGYKIREILEVNGYDDDRKDYNYINIYRYEG